MNLSQNIILNIYVLMIIRYIKNIKYQIIILLANQKPVLLKVKTLSLEDVLLDLIEELVDIAKQLK